MRLLIRFPIFSAKNSFISGHIIKLLKYFNELKTISSYSGSGLALAHKVHICYEKLFIV